MTPFGAIDIFTVLIMVMASQACTQVEFLMCAVYCLLIIPH